MTSRSMNASDAHRVFSDVRGILTDALGQMDRFERPEANELSFACLIVGLCNEQLDNRSEALTAYDSAVMHDPTNEYALIRRALLVRESDNPQFVEDLTSVITRGTKYVLPYLLLASTAVETHEYHLSRVLCEFIRRVTRDPRPLAVASYFEAIAELETRGATADARTLFDQAQRLDPTNHVFGRHGMVAAVLQTANPEIPHGNNIDWKPGQTFDVSDYDPLDQALASGLALAA